MTTRPPTSSQKESPKTRVLAATTVGTALEWFDFALYGALAGVVFPHVFFPDSTPAIAVVQSFATFGVGFLARPIGAAWFSRIADRDGRKKAMVLSLTMMGVVSLLIACLPGYNTIGVWAPALLVALRFIQGFCLGGEASSAQIMALEYAGDLKRGFYGAMVNFGNPVGQILVALFLIFAGVAFGDQALQEWGWRLPFIAGALIAVVGYFIRRKVEESPVFLEAQELGAQSSTPIREVFRTHRTTIIKLILVWLPNTALSYIVSTYAISYMVTNLSMSSTLTFSLVLGLNVCGLALIPLGGFLSDKIGRKRLLLISMPISFLGTIALFPLLDTRTVPLMFLAMLFSQGAQFVSVGAMAAFFAEPFPTSVRYSGHAAVYTINNLVAGSTAPFAAALLLSTTGTTWSIIAVVGILFVIAFIALTQLRETRWDSFESNHGIETPVPTTMAGVN